MLRAYCAEAVRDNRYKYGGGGQKLKENGRDAYCDYYNLQQEVHKVFLCLLRMRLSHARHATTPA